MIAYMAFCLHQFCFTCIKEWARRRARCPLCRKHFNLVLHSVQADDRSCHGFLLQLNYIFRCSSLFGKLLRRHIS
uniref:RING-type E3 ubiquitin transferase n=1 Tax=Calidris pygmaea TaxID=425635 RepID=A0A8C3K6G6_9CHAR